MRQIANLFALWTVAGTAWAWFVLEHFTWFVSSENRIFGVKLIHLGLGVIMLGMGVTFSFADFREVLRVLRKVALGVACQSVIMPFVGYTLARLSGLETGLATGLILVSCCPGGTASNVVAYLARANLALSVLVTMCSTLVAIAMTPILTGWLAGKFVEADRWNLFLNMVAVVLVPVFAGVALRQLFPKLLRWVTPWSPLLSVAIIVLIVGGIVGASKELIREHFGILLLVVFLLHAMAFLLGYVIAKALRLPIIDRRTICIEMGMQNSGLGSSLAKTEKFQAQFATPLEGGVGHRCPPQSRPVYHCIIGSLLAAIWRRQKADR